MWAGKTSARLGAGFGVTERSPQKRVTERSPVFGSRVTVLLLPILRKRSTVRSPDLSARRVVRDVPCAHVGKEGKAACRKFSNKKGVDVYLLRVRKGHLGQ
jgi:hypothetical protein